jgi:hypothetical protein
MLKCRMLKCGMLKCRMLKCGMLKGGMLKREFRPELRGVGSMDKKKGEKINLK